MKFLITLLFCFIYLDLVEPGWFDSFPKSYSVSNDDIFAKAYSQAKHHVTDMQKKVQDEEAKREKKLPVFEAGSFGSYATKVIGSAKKATETYISGVRNTATELTRSLISAAANTGVDLLLSEYKLMSDTMGIGNKLTLPDIQQSAYGFEVKATGGHFSSLSSLEKSDRIEVTIEDKESATLEIPMRFNEMNVGFDHFEVKAFMFFSASGSFSINVPKNSIVIKLRLGMDSTCALNVEKVTIKELDGITIKFEGLGSYAGMISERLSNFLISYLKENISRHIQDAVDSNLRTVLDSNSMICSKFVPT